jgi:hypothetical protein
MAKVPFSVLEDMQDDEDALIQHFLDSNKKQVICEYFVSGNCRYGDNC